MVQHSPLVAIAAAAVALASSSIRAAEVWPLPQSITTGNTLTYLDSEFDFNCAMADGTSSCPDPMPAIFARYNTLLFVAGAPGPLQTGTSTVKGVNITITASAPLAFQVSENYTLSIPVSGYATLVADTQWGALRGIESLSQLFVWSGYYASMGSQYELDLAPVTIVDYPRWPWRSLLIDSSRHYLLPSAIMSTIDAMSYNKLNTLHWHIVDDNSWPLYSESYPNFTQGAYAPDAIYSHEDITTIVQYAFERGVRIVPEFDMPAHAEAWGTGYPELIISCAQGQSLLNPTPDGGVYEVVDGLLKEFIPLFGNTDFIHFGGDEVEDLTCWNNSADVQAFMKAEGLPDVNAVRNYFETRVQQIALNYSASSMFWEEVFDDGYTVMPDSVVDIWLSYDEVSAATAAGRRIVSSFGLYLDQQDPDGASHYFWADTWQNFFLNDPTFNTSLTPAQEALIMGESLSQWGEQVSSENIQSRIWPRASGGAERMWGDKNNRDVASAEGRLDRFRCKMAQRGIGAGPIRPASQYGYCPTPRASRFLHTHEVKAQL